MICLASPLRRVAPRASAALPGAHPPHRAARTLPGLALAALVLAAAAGAPGPAAAIDMLPLPRPLDYRVVDGDTIAVDGRRIRILDLDAPETAYARCEAEHAAGIKARDELARLLATHAWTVVPDGRDRYGRTLAVIEIETAEGPVSVAKPMVAAGVAAPWIGKTRDWCAILGGAR
ncbi:Endonuclease YncB, thermonuclease family [Pseudoxanthobacter soli DSM 19599]|uniref:Endonuclease YncB, thermonuclease family n=1 Tax=Pseudoxanthobacter soli DSM 19599 TaxID=1123029 RepID=A0A1M7ZLR8_9HYPH|nr:thermonuclease family protein [Pseudoxanthobacter soli]SHO65845.1 Endonuclease YncB, thermonuclease family [Pseudoxanthobacter soli DSM 19599]